MYASPRGRIYINGKYIIPVLYSFYYSAMSTITEIFATSNTIEVEVEVEFEYVMTRAEKRDAQKAKVAKAMADKAAIEAAKVELAAMEVKVVEVMVREPEVGEVVEVGEVKVEEAEVTVEQIVDVEEVKVGEVKQIVEVEEVAEVTVQEVEEVAVKITKTMALSEFYKSKFQSAIESEEKFMKIPAASDFSEFDGPETFNTTLASLNKIMIINLIDQFQKSSILSASHSLLVVISPEGRDPLEFRASREKIDPSASNCIHFVLSEKTSLPEATKTGATKTAGTKTAKNAWPSKSDVDEALAKAEPHKDGLTPSVVYTVPATIDELEVQCANVYQRKYCLTKDQPADTSKVRFRLFKENKSSWKPMKSAGEKKKDSTGAKRKQQA